MIGRVQFEHVHACGSRFAQLISVISCFNVYTRRGKTASNWSVSDVVKIRQNLAFLKPGSH